MANRDQRPLDDRTGEGTSSFVTMGFAIAAVGSIALLIAKFLGPRGEEAPIRVRGGSIYVDLLGLDDTWEEKSPGSGRWRFKKDGKRDHDNYRVVISAKNPHPVNGRKQTITITNSDKEVVTVQSKGKKTEVTSSATLILRNGDRTLCYESKDTYIENISFEDGTSIDFGKEDLDCLDAHD